MISTTPKSSKVLLAYTTVLILSSSALLSTSYNKGGGGGGGIVVSALSIATPKKEFRPHDTFDMFVTMRTGVNIDDNNQDSDIAFWTGEGQLYESPSGRLLANFDGFDVSRGVQINENEIRQFSRKIFWFRDPETNELLTEYNGMPVQPIKYDWQVFDYKRGVSSVSQEPAPILTSVVKGPRIVPSMPVRPRYTGNSVLCFHIPLFIDIKTPQGKVYQAWEVYDYTIDTSLEKNFVCTDRPPTVSWSRQGSNLPFTSNGVMHFMGQRVAKYEDLAPHMRELVEQTKEYSMFKAPPENMEEIHERERKQQEKLMAMNTK